MQTRSVLKDLALNNRYALPVSSEIREFDRQMIESGITETDLIKKVAQELFQVIEKIIEPADSILVVSGKGNNGADGIALASLLHASQKYSVTLVVLDENKNQELVTQYSGQKADFDVNEFADLVQKSDFIIDAILGVGQTKPLYGNALKAVRIINENNCAVISIDTPTGIATDSGEVFRDAICPQYTIFIQEVKRGLAYLEFKHLGEIFIIDAGIKIGKTQTKILGLLDLNLPGRELNSHKKTNPDCFVVGGSPNMPGGHDLAVKAAIRSGAGYLRTFRYPYSNLPSEVLAIESITHLKISHFEDIIELISERTILTIGSALGLNDDSKQLVEELLKLPNPKIIDADGVNILAELNITLENAILTPHAKEASRLLDVDVSVINTNRFDAAKTLALSYNSVIVLKGFGTIITNGEEFFVNPTGNPYLATAGTGDVLTGIITGLVSSGSNLFEAAKLGCFIHGHCADVAIEKGFPIIASDLIEHIPGSFEYVHSNRLA